MKRQQIILVPTDFGDASVAAWHQAQWLATQLGGEIHLLHVISPPAFFDAWGTEGLALRVSELLEDAERVARERLQALVPTSGSLARRVRIATAVGPTVDRILDYADEHAADFIVMGTHGRGALGHLLLGSVAERCVQRATVPVLTVHAQKTMAVQPVRRRPVARVDLRSQSQRREIRVEK